MIKTKDLIKQMEERKIIMQHFADGGNIEIIRRLEDEEWEPCSGPIWDWVYFDYRITKEKKYFYKYRYKKNHNGFWAESTCFYENDKEFINGSGSNMSQEFKRDWGSKIDEDGEKC